MTAKRGPLLTNLLRVIVEEYGHAEVVRALTQLPYNDGPAGPAFGNGRLLSQHRGLRGEGLKPKRPTAVDQTIKLTAEAEEPDALLLLAARFDRKDFLPSSADIREFLAMMGQNVEGVKDRAEGFRLLLPLLAKLPSERIRRLANSTSHSGPAQLGPLADAIRSAGETMRRGDQMPDSNPTPSCQDDDQQVAARQTTTSGANAPSLTKTEAADKKPARDDEMGSSKKVTDASADHAEIAPKKTSNTVTS